MIRPIFLAISLGALGCASGAAAQDAAESAAILAGTGERTGAASRSVGEAATGAIGRAGNAIAATRNARRSGTVPNRSARTRSTARDANAPAAVYSIAGNVDVLDRFETPTYRLPNGRILRVSGEFRPEAGTACIRMCPGDAWPGA